MASPERDLFPPELCDGKESGRGSCTMDFQSVGSMRIRRTTKLIAAKNFTGTEYSWEKASAVIRQFCDIWIEMAPWLLIGAAAAALVHILLPTGFISRHLSGRLGVLKAVLIGIPLPLCSCAVIPAGLGLKKSGASDGAAVGFLISTPQTGIDSILVSGSLLGWPFAILKVAVALVTGWVGGALAGDSAQRQPPQLNVLDANTPAGESVQSSPQDRWPAFRQHFVMLIQSLWGWLVLGVLISAAIGEWIPKETVANLPGFQGWASLFLVLLIAIPLYVCATASVPIAAALVGSGLSPGAALVFLMAGPATNIATIGAVYRTLGRKSMLVYLATIMVGSILAGAMFNAVIPASVVTEHTHGHSVSWWELAAAGLLAIMVAWFAAQDGVAFLKRFGAVPVTGRRFHIEGMTCNGCASTLRARLTADQDIDSADVSFASSLAVVQGTASDAQVSLIAQEAGFVASPADTAS